MSTSMQEAITPELDVPPPHVPTKRGSRIVTIVLVGLLVVSLVIFFLPLSRVAVGGNAVAMMIILMMLRLPLAMSMLVPSLLGMLVLGSERVVENVMAVLPFNTTASWSLSVLPMFILMGIMLTASGISRDLFTAARAWLGWLPGGLAVATNLAGTGLGSVSGSSSGVTYALTRMAVPEMFKAGYDRRLALGSVIVAGLPGQLIPPSILLVLYAGVANTSVGETLLAGVGPGLLVSASFTVMIILFAWLGRGWVPKGVRLDADLTWKDRFRTLVHIWPLPILILVVIGGMLSGVFTATEAGAVAALAAVLVLFARKRPKEAIRAFGDASGDAVSAFGTIMFLLIGVGALSQMLNLTGIGAVFADFVEHLGLGRIEFLLLMTVVYLVLGAFMETLPMIVLTLPVLMPTLEALDISLLWYGAFVVLMGEIGMISPPVGVLAMIIYSIVRDPKVANGQRLGIKDVWIAGLWFLPMAIVVLLLLILFPEVATWLPEQARSSP
jgi:tripartite ATP-independent transporter DctM subunit